MCCFNDYLVMMNRLVVIIFTIFSEHLVCEYLYYFFADFTISFYLFLFFLISVLHFFPFFISYSGAPPLTSNHCWEDSLTHLIFVTIYGQRKPHNEVESQSQLSTWWGLGRQSLLIYWNFILCWQIYKIYMIKYCSYATNSVC